MDLYFFKDLQRKLSPKKKKKVAKYTLRFTGPGVVEASLGTPCQGPGPFYTVLAVLWHRANNLEGKHRPDRKWPADLPPASAF